MNCGTCGKCCPNGRLLPEEDQGKGRCWRDEEPGEPPREVSLLYGGCASWVPKSKK